MSPRLQPQCAPWWGAGCCAPWAAGPRPGATLRFGHGLVRDVAYGGMPKADRARLHERFATWLEDVTGERADEYEAILGYHLERATAT